MASQKDMLLSWLNDAYSMEQALIPVLENHAKDAKDIPEVAARDTQHIEETRRHAELVKSCIDRLGGDVSTIKTAMGKMTGMVQSVASEPFQDELIKNFLSDYAAENFEIASYKALIAAAQDLGDQETVRVCQEILREDEAMAQWIDQNLPMAVRLSMQKKGAT